MQEEPAINPHVMNSDEWEGGEEECIRWFDLPAEIRPAILEEALRIPGGFL